MIKIGRNDPCPCGSGRKFKRCCLQKTTVESSAPPAPKAAPTLGDEIKKIQQAAAEGREMVREVGVFVMFATKNGDAWLLELTEADAVRLAFDRQPLEIEIDENPQTIEIKWTHRFAVRNRQFVTTTYEDKQVEVFEGYPTNAIKPAMKRVRRRYPEEELSKLHLDEKKG